MAGPVRSAAFGPNIRPLSAYASHEPALKGDLTALENLRFAVGLKRRSRQRESARESGAHRGRRLAPICRRACCRPANAAASPWREYWRCGRSLWLLDEPFTNLDAAGTDCCPACCRRMWQGGGLALVVAHHDLDRTAMCAAWNSTHERRRGGRPCLLWSCVVNCVSVSGGRINCCNLWCSF